MVSATRAARILGVSTRTLRRYTASGVLADRRSPGGKRVFSVVELEALRAEAGKLPDVEGVVLYGRVSSQRQRSEGDLDRQMTRLRKAAAGRPIVGEYFDVASGLSDQRRGLRRALTLCQRPEVSVLLVEHEERLARFGTGVMRDVMRRERMGRGGRGKRFRKAVAGIPTARFRERLRGMAFHARLVVIAVDPAYTSIWGERYWKTPLQQQHKKTTVTRHHGAAVAIGRRGLGHRIRRRPGVTAHDQRIVPRRAAGQTVFVPKPRGTASPPRTASAPVRGGKTRQCQGDQLALFPDPEDRSWGHRITDPVCVDSADTGQSAQERLNGHSWSVHRHA
nr:recombinase family protein [Streptomyces sp. NBC_00886]